MRHYAICLIFILSLGFASSGWAQTCPRPAGIPASPQLNVAARVAPVQYDFSRGHDELAALNPSKNVVRQALSHVRGLTAAQMIYTLNASFLISPSSAGFVCLWPSSITADIGYDSMIVYVDKKYRTGSCQHSAILNHEREHVKINNMFLQSYMPWFESEFRRQVAGIYPISARTADEAREKALRQLGDIAKGLVRTMETARDQQHSRLDLPESYQYTQRQCSSW